jgi:hypothetical protein
MEIALTGELINEKDLKIKESEITSEQAKRETMGEVDR